MKLPDESASCYNTPNVGGGDTDKEEMLIQFSVKSYCKMALHAAKYPHCAVNGLLIGYSTQQQQKLDDENEERRDGEGEDSNKTIIISDVIPLFHQIHGLTPLPEMALHQSDLFCLKQNEGDDDFSSNIKLMGVYHANERLTDTSISKFTLKMFDKMIEDQSSSNNKNVLVTLNNTRLIDNNREDDRDDDKGKGGGILQNGSLLVRMPTGVGQASKEELLLYPHFYHPQCQLFATLLIERCVYRDLVDFDNHLDDVSLDYLTNETVNLAIDELVNG